MTKKYNYKSVMLHMNESLYYKVREQAKKLNMPVSTYIKMELTKLMEGIENESRAK